MICAGDSGFQSADVQTHLRARDLGDANGAILAGNDQLSNHPVMERRDGGRDRTKYLPRGEPLASRPGPESTEVAGRSRGSANEYLSPSRLGNATAKVDHLLLQIKAGGDFRHAIFGLNTGANSWPHPAILLDKVEERRSRLGMLLLMDRFKQRLPSPNGPA